MLFFKLFFFCLRDFCNSSLRELLFLLTASRKSRLEKAAELVKEESETAYLENLIIEARSFLLAKKGVRNFFLPHEPISDLPAADRLTALISKLQKALAVLENTNINKRLLLENLLLEFTPQEC